MTEGSDYASKKKLQQQQLALLIKVKNSNKNKLIGSSKRHTVLSTRNLKTVINTEPQTNGMRSPVLALDAKPQIGSDLKAKHRSGSIKSRKITDLVQKSVSSKELLSRRSVIPMPSVVQMSTLESYVEEIKSQQQMKEEEQEERKSKGLKPVAGASREMI